MIHPSSAMMMKCSTRNTKEPGIKYTCVNKEIKLQQAGRKQMLNTQIENKRTTKLLNLCAFLIFICFFFVFRFSFFFVKTREQQTKANN